MAVSIEVFVFLLVLPPVSVTVIFSIVLAKAVRSVVSFKTLATTGLPAATEQRVGCWSWCTSAQPSGRRGWSGRRRCGLRTDRSFIQGMLSQFTAPVVEIVAAAAIVVPDSIAGLPGWVFGV